MFSDELHTHIKLILENIGCTTSLNWLIGLIQAAKGTNMSKKEIPTIPK